MLPKIQEEIQSKANHNQSFKTVQVGKTTDKLVLKKKGVSFTKADRNMNPVAGKNSPGPCNYQTNQYKNEKSVSFTRGLRQGKDYKFITPGPGSYQTSSKQKQKTNQFTIPGKFYYEQIRLITPGPGDYQLAGQIKGEKQQFGKAQRFLNDKRSFSPGPGDYQIKDQSLSKSQSFKTFTKDNKMPDRMPGPSDYSTQIEGHNTMHYHKGFTIASRYKQNSQSITDTAYNKYFQRGFPTQLVKSKSKAFSIGKSERLQDSKFKTPSPSTYEAQDRSRVRPLGSVFPKSKYTTKAEITPGPGQYNKQNGTNTSPGYTIKRSSSIPTIISRQATPGVGSYDVLNKFGSGGTSGKNSIFTKSKRYQFASNNKVGVGEYNIK